MIAGLNAAYDLAGQHLNATTLSRVLLFGDGQANVGETDVQRFSELTRNGNGEGLSCRRWASGPTWTGRA
ncbi:MAG: hypothetical protein ACO1OB_08230 [Archangium sp.]